MLFIYSNNVILLIIKEVLGIYVCLLSAKSKNLRKCHSKFVLK